MNTGISIDMSRAIRFLCGGLLVMGPACLCAGESAYNVTDYASPLTVRVPSPAEWLPSPGAWQYTGALDATWFAALASDRDEVSISTAEAIKMGAPSDFSLMTGPDNCWGMLMNFGLVTLASEADLVVTLSADKGLASRLAPAFALYQGWDTSETATRHQVVSFGSDNPLGTQGLKFIADAYASNTQATVARTLTRLAPGNYELFVTNRSNAGQHGSYTVNLKTYPPGTAANTVVKTAELCGSANNQLGAVGLGSDLCVYGFATALPHQMTDGRYTWSCGVDKGLEPLQMCYSLSSKNRRSNQIPVRLAPGHVSVAVNQSVTQVVSGGSGTGALSFTLAGSTRGLGCRLTRKSGNLVVATAKNKTGTCLVYAKKSASSKFNEARSVTYRINFLPK